MPLLLVLAGQSTLRGFTLGLVAGLIYFAGTLYWVTNVMAIYGGIPTPGAVGINALLVLYQAVYLCLFGAIIARLTRLGGVRHLLATPLVWVSLEFARTHVLGGFPWVLLGYSQASILPIAQFASVTGIFGLSYVVAAINAGVAFALVAQARRRRHALVPVAVTLVAVVVIALWGSVRIRRGVLMAAGDPVRVGLIQGNVDQSDKTDARRARGVYASYLQMTRQAIFQGAQFVVWPESAAPFVFEDDPLSLNLRKIASEAKVSVLLGTDQVEPGPSPRYYNGAVMLDANGKTAGTYQKMHLVPFGEYVPARQLFFFMSRLVEGVSDFTAGTRQTLLPVGEHMVSTSICYEVVYPDAVRRFSNSGAELLTTITNDAWFGRTSAPYQHFVQASMRAVENGRFLVRAANTGVSGIVDPYGRVVEATAIYEPAIVMGDVRFLRTQTIYSRIGDVVAETAIGASLVLLFTVRRRVQ